MKLLKKIFSIVCIASIISFFAPVSLQAEGTCNYPGCFGGVATFEYFCDCTENFLITFEPFYVYGIPGAEAGELAFEPGTMAYSTYDILPTEGVIGAYVPAAPGCWEYIGYGCIPIEPQFGTILPEVGASYPGGGTLY